MGKYLTKDDILNAMDRHFEEVPVPEWGGVVRVSTITGAARDRFETGVRSDNGKMNLANVRARLVAVACVDDKGNLIFSDSDVMALGEKSAVALDRVFDVAMKLAGLRPQDVDELTENFTATPNGASISA